MTLSSILAVTLEMTLEVSQLDHCIHPCTKYVGTGEMYWENNFDVSTYIVYLVQLSQDNLTEIILGKHSDRTMADGQWWLILEMGARKWQILAYYY